MMDESGSTQRERTVLASLPLCMATLDPTTFHPIAVNDLFERHMGPLYKFADSDFCMGACGEDVVHSDERDGVDGSKNQNSHDRLRAALEDIQNRPEGHRTRLRGVEMTTVADQNSGFPIRRYFDWFISRCPRSGEIILLGDPCSDQDLTQRHKEAELIDFFQNAAIALHWLTGDGKVLWANQTELNVLGYTAEEYIGQPIMNFCPDEQELVLEIFKTLGSGNTIKDVPVRFRTKNGKIVHLLIDSNVKYNPDGSFGHTRCFIRDDTGRKIRQARAALLLEETKRSLTMLDNFMARTLHHMRTPLHMTQNIIDTISTHVMMSPHLNDLGKKQRQQCNDILGMATTQISSSIQLLDDVVDLGKFDQGLAMPIFPEPTSMTAFGHSFLQQLPTKSLKQGVKVVLELAPQKERFLYSTYPGPDYAMIDPQILHRILNYLVESALDMIQQGAIVLRIGFGRDKRLTFAISDTGPGLEMAPNAAAGDLPLIFQRYHQALLPEEVEYDFDDQATDIRRKVEESVATHTKQRTEVGLGVSYHLVRALGGELRCSSVMGRGTTFWFSVPRGVSHDQSIPAQPILPNGKWARRLPPPPAPEPEQEATIPLEDDELMMLEPAELVTDDEEEFTSKRKKRTFERPQDELPRGDNATMASQGISSQSAPSILVVEDTTACAKFLCMTLAKFNCSCSLARNGQEAMEILQNATAGTYDLILMDLRMPVMDGLEATRLLKATLGFVTPIIAITGDDYEETMVECKKIGFDAFHGKPIRRNVLKQILKDFTGYEVQ